MFKPLKSNIKMKTIKTLLATITALLICFYLSSFVANAIESPAAAVYIAGALITLALFKTKQIGVLSADISPDVSAIQKYAANTKVKLLRHFFNMFDIANDITLQPNVKNSMPLPLLIINGKPRPYTGNHMPNAGDIGYSDRELTVGDFQRDFAIDPRLYKNTYLNQFRGAGEGANNNVIPFAQYTLETAIGNNAAILNNSTAFNGLGKTVFAVFNPASVYVAGNTVKFTGSDNEPHYFRANATTTAGQSPLTTAAKWDNVDELAICIGLGTHIKAARTGGAITNVASTGAITSIDGYNQALAVYRKLPEPLRMQSKDIFLYASSDNVDKIEDSFGDNISKYTQADGSLTVLPRTNGVCKIKRASWMNGSNMMIASPKSNLFMGTDLLSDMNDINTVPQVYRLDMGLTGLLGFQFSDAEAIATNDQN
jgi:plastocyanin